MRNANSGNASHSATRAISAYLRLLRPHHWLKNTFVFIGLLFSHSWGNVPLVQSVLLAFAAFCLASSATYVVNDYLDRESDQQHPKKKQRPLADGSATPSIALGMAVVLVLAALYIAASVSLALLLIIVGYQALSVTYSMWLKHVAILDVFAISMGFVLRLLAGTEGVGIEPSSWLLLCGMMVTLFLGFSKRRAELGVLESTAVRHRRVFDQYPDALLDHLVSICAGATIVTYGLYTASPDVIALHGTGKLAYSVPFAVYGIFRYLYRLFQGHCEGDAAEDIISDPHLLISSVGWFVVIVWALS
jgi:4-hydroxybenzoate polyprenyltransferase